MKKKISQAVTQRMPRYYRYLGELMDEGVERISSHDLSDRMHVTASQIRQDLNQFGGFGQQGYGYNVKYLYEEIAKIMGLDQKYHIIIVGAGNLGQALANYIKFERRGFLITALFDENPQLMGIKVRGVPIRPMEELPELVAENPAEIAALTLPKEVAAEAARTLYDLVSKDFWNFAHLDLDLPEEVVVENVHLSDSLMQLTINISQNQQETQEHESLS